MRGRMLLYTITFGFMTALALTILVINLAGGSLELADVGNPVALMATSWVSLITELGRRRHGHVGPGWIVSVLVLVALTLAVNLTIVTTANQGVFRTSITVVLLAVAIGLSVSVLVDNPRNRLGLPVKRRLSPPSK